MEYQSHLIRTAIKEIRRGEELVNSLLTRHQLHADASDLSVRILEKLTAALAILKSKETNSEISSDCSKTQRRRLSAIADLNETDRERRIVLTPAPHHDGHQWRKYGQKKIINSNHPRSYYRCSYKDEGCPATKLVQEEESGDSPMFRVIYSNQHTCRANISDCNPEIIFSSPHQQSNIIIFESKNSSSLSSNIMSKQEKFIPLTTQNERPIRELCSPHSENGPSLITNSIESGLTEATVDSLTVKESPPSPGCFLDPFEFEFDAEDVSSLLSTFM